MSGSAKRVSPLTTELFVKRLPIKGNAVTLRTYPGADHMGLLDACRMDVIAWMGDRLRHG